VRYVRTGQLMRRLGTHVGYVFDVSFMPDESGLVSGSDGMLKYWFVHHSILKSSQTQQSCFDNKADA